MKRGRVLQVLPYHLGLTGGGESGVRSVIEATIDLTSPEWEHVILVPGPSAFDAIWIEHGARVVSLGRRGHLILRRTRSPLRVAAHALQLLVDVPRIARLIRRERIDIVHSHSSAYLGAVIAARLLRRPAVVHVHERLDTLPPWTAALYRRLVGRLATRVVVIARFLGDEWAGSGATIRSISNTARWDAVGVLPEAPPPVVGFVGRIAPRKGIEYLVAALDIVRRQIPSVRLVVYGSPTEPEDHRYLESLTNDVEQRDLSGFVSFEGAISDVRAAFAGIRVLGFTSPRDIAPITVLEAMSCAVPVVSASDGGAEDMMDDGVTGFSVAPMDEEAIAEAILRLLQDDALWRVFSANAAVRYESVFGRERYARAVSDLYLELTGAGTSSDGSEDSP